ncbi:uncharacterized protein LOC132611543 [Lycium barbarum]|uniref:uncharacterized protein LOC132611543 n=1 Tax=Lycium barbarum TaxID=112863 RepID=UPI00293E644B|nr:uncharacterized protein LOC132611543 [Lycium barbarum]
MPSNDEVSISAARSANSDMSSPYYLHPSDSPGMTLVNSSFDGKGFGGWRRSILIALSAKNKLGFINGVIKSPSDTSADFNLWNRRNDMVTSWLLNSLSKEIASSVIYSKSAEELWTALEDRFGQPNGAKLYHLQKELNDLVQGSNNIAGYFTKIKCLWDELDALTISVQCSCTCTCRGKEKVIKSFQDERLIQFLMGLNDAYTGVKSNILMMSPLPNVNVAYSLLVQDEKQREVYVSSQFPVETSSFLAAKQVVHAQQSFLTANHAVPPQQPQQKYYSSDYKGKKNNLIVLIIRRLVTLWISVTKS